MAGQPIRSSQGVRPGHLRQDVGKCLRADQVNRLDIEEIGHEIGRARKELDTALLPLQRRAAAAAKTMIANFDSNAKMLREANGALAAQIEEHRKLTDDRKEAIKGLTLADMAAAAGTTDENPEMEEA